MQVTRRSLRDGPHSVTITRPDDSTTTLQLTETAPGRFTAEWEGAEPGLYRLRSEDLDTVAVLGTANPREYERVVGDAAPLQPLIEATGGGVAVLASGLPSLRVVEAGRQASGRGWLGVTRARPMSPPICASTRCSRPGPGCFWARG